MIVLTVCYFNAESIVVPRDSSLGDSLDVLLSVEVGASIQDIERW